MTLKCSAEPKRRYLAQSCYFDVKVEPFWLNDEIYPNGKRSGFQYYEAEKCAEITVLENCFSLCPAERVLRYNKQGLCVPQKSPSQPKSADSLGAYRPQSPEKKNERRNVVYERYTNRRACHGKRKRENTIKSPKVRA